MNERTSMIAVLIVIIILAAAVIGMLLAAPRVLRANAPDVIGGEGNDILTGDKGANRFVCGEGNDTITDFNPAEGDTKTADCENF